MIKKNAKLLENAIMVGALVPCLPETVCLVADKNENLYFAINTVRENTNNKATITNNIPHEGNQHSKYVAASASASPMIPTWKKEKKIRYPTKTGIDELSTIK